MSDREQNIISALGSESSPSIFIVNNVTYYAYSNFGVLYISDGVVTHNVGISPTTYNVTPALDINSNVQANLFWLWCILDGVAMVIEYSIEDFTTPPASIRSKVLPINEPVGIYGNVLSGFSPIAGVLDSSTLYVYVYTDPLAIDPLSATTLGWDPTYSDNLSISRDDNNSTFNIAYTTTVDGVSNVVVVYSLSIYTVTFYDKYNNVLDTQYISYGSDAVAPIEPTVIGYTFKEWDHAVTNVIADMNITAVYDINVFTVRYLDWDGTVISDQMVDYNLSPSIPTDPIRLGYTFKEWDSVVTNVVEDIDIHAVYDINVFTVRYLDWDGTLISDQMVDYNLSPGIPTGPTRLGYTFKEWDPVVTNVVEDIDITALYSLNPTTGLEIAVDLAVEDIPTNLSFRYLKFYGSGDSSQNSKGMGVNIPATMKNPNYTGFRRGRGPVILFE